MRGLRFWVAGLLLGLVCGPAVGEEPIWAERIDSIGVDAVTGGETVGISIAIAVDGELVYGRAFGVANLEHHVTLDGDSLMRIGSVTKQFTAAAVMKLIERGELSLETTLVEALPDWPISRHPDTDAPITIEHLLSHTSGIPDYANVDRFEDELIAIPLNLADMADLIRTEPFTHEPGTDWRYSNMGYWLLSAIIERVSGTDFETFMRDELFSPAGLELTRFDSNVDVIFNRAQGYTLGPEGPRNDRQFATENIRGDGALLSTAKELVRWSRALSSGEVVSAASYSAMAEPRNEMGIDGWSYGYGLIIEESFGGTKTGRTKVFHTGGIMGFNALLAQYSPAEEDSRDIVIAVLCNTAPWGKSVRERTSNKVEIQVAEVLFGIASD